VKNLPLKKKNQSVHSREIRQKTVEERSMKPGVGRRAWGKRDSRSGRRDAYTFRVHRGEGPPSNKRNCFEKQETQSHLPIQKVKGGQKAGMGDENPEGHKNAQKKKEQKKGFKIREKKSPESTGTHALGTRRTGGNP